ncbi:hypothetical protein F5X99DRAFT_387229 [Biscogniauxia marginata]|nr:hypothetical protein F5X99DRAFT_387229 [Biscogniauxia marginata]
MIVPISYILSTLATIAIALPAKQPRGVTVDLTTDGDLNPQDFINSIQDTFEEKCHIICLTMFPDEGLGQDACMKICHNNHNNNMDQEA